MRGKFTYKTVSIMYGKTFKNKLADFMRKRGWIKVMYQVPITDADSNEIGCVCTLKCKKNLVWLIERLFNREGVELQMFLLPNEKRFEVI